MRGIFGSADLSTSAPPGVGKFIVFEGGDGSGKTTFVELLKKEHPEYVYTQDPGGTALGEQIRGMLMSTKTSGIDVRAELLLFLASRAQMVAEVIRPALESGTNVVSNRFALSSIAYQIYGRQRPDLLPLYRSVSDVILEQAMPDATIFLDVEPEVGLARAHSRPEEMSRFDLEEIAFHERVREGYKKHLSEFGTPFIIDAGRPLEEVWQSVQKALQSLL